MDFTQRNYKIDNLKGILIFLVVLGHGLELIRQSIPSAKIIYTFIYQFHMPMFVFLSGCTSKNLEKGRKNAVRNFLVPFFVLNLIWSILHLFSTYLENSFTNYPLHSLLTPRWTLWYMLALFVWKILLPDLCRIKHIIFVSLCVGVISGIFTEFDDFLSLSRIIKLFPFFMFGYFYDISKHKTISTVKKILAIFILPITIIYTYIIIKIGIPESFFWWDRPFIANEITSIELGLILSIIGYIIGFGWIFLGNILMSSKKIFLSQIGKNTFSVYLLHTYCIIIPFALTMIVPIPTLKIVIMVIFSMIITWVLSQNKINEQVNKFIDKLNLKIFQKSDTN